LVAQTTDDIGLTTAGVIGTEPLIGETFPGDELADRPQAAATSAHAAAAMIIHRFGHPPIVSPALLHVSMPN